VPRNGQSRIIYYSRIVNPNLEILFSAINTINIKKTYICYSYKFLHFIVHYCAHVVMHTE